MVDHVQAYLVSQPDRALRDHLAELQASYAKHQSVAVGHTMRLIEAELNARRGAGAAIEEERQAFGQAS